MTLTSGAQRRRWPLLVAAGVVVVLVAVLAGWLIGRGSGDEPGTAAPPITDAPATNSTTTASNDTAVTSSTGSIDDAVAAACATRDVGAAAVALRPELPRTVDAGVRLTTAYLEWLAKYPADANYEEIARELVYVDAAYPYGQTLLADLKQSYEETAAAGTVTRLVLPDSIQVSVEGGVTAEPRNLIVVVLLTSRATKSDGSTQDMAVTQNVIVTWGAEGWRISALTAPLGPPKGQVVPAAPLCG